MDVSNGILTSKMAEEKILLFSQEEFKKSGNVFINKLQEAARRGFFYLEIPENCKELIPFATEFANRFYREESIINREQIRYTGYHNKEGTQKESLFVEDSEWKKNWFSDEIVRLATHMQTLAVSVLQKILAAVEIPEEQWEMATGGAISGGGMHHFTFNHYRPEKDEPGLNPHRDYGLLTLLFIEKGGLEAEIDGAWVPISPKKDYFVINISRALEAFVNNKEKMNAVWHQVIKVKEDRISFGLFSDPRLDSPIYKREPDESITTIYTKYKEFADMCFKEGYPGNTIRFKEEEI
ncbi:MAG: isopenicillin N synthase family oxygenase [Parachlamydiaceae bacterium]|nr:isopenicillin N synthase family oxygenase [Parachlamydiaceae bacterium]